MEMGRRGQVLLPHPAASNLEREHLLEERITSQATPELTPKGVQIPASPFTDGPSWTLAGPRLMRPIPMHHLVLLGFDINNPHIPLGGL